MTDPRAAWGAYLDHAGDCPDCRAAASPGGGCEEGGRLWRAHRQIQKARLEGHRRAAPGQPTNGGV